ncbi:unnamed protein product [Protopolystoma xenopodis]|uniref:Translation elongation factor EFTu-like domain-containing protein n=1 Tax=Protopolystoma xenopodis TaxID=117903 RepID=A0A3S5AVL3_9PLAT|nr:unnamed protein product [Protopolystoma xenopodis]
MRVYQGCLNRGDTIWNMRSNKKFRISRLGRVNVQNFEDLEKINSGDIAALFGIECYSGDTLVDQVLKKENLHMVCFFK